MARIARLGPSQRERRVRARLFALRVSRVNGGAFARPVAVAGPPLDGARGTRRPLERDMPLGGERRSNNGLAGRHACSSTRRRPHRPGSDRTDARVGVARRDGPDDGPSWWQLS
jgi:hypothetical protein